MPRSTNIKSGHRWLPPLQTATTWFNFKQPPLIPQKTSTFYFHSNVAARTSKTCKIIFCFRQTWRCLVTLHANVFITAMLLGNSVHLFCKHEQKISIYIIFSGRGAETANHYLF